ncbi:hypothetical protein TCAL_03294 [Tigriopus californicus]|uniref:C2H2-type domain-containing protein n=2 Tax=Tigriopus californicus TaxID=6832 RepID=A0A553NPD1_TIGCA|nr:hypothetical protein TCAL_03294 [Tigriopus californicus]
MASTAPTIGATTNIAITPTNSSSLSSSLTTAGGGVLGVGTPPSSSSSLLSLSGAVSNGINGKKTDKAHQEVQPRVESTSKRSREVDPEGGNHEEDHGDEEDEDDDFEPPSSPESKTEPPHSPPPPPISSLCSPNERATMTEPDNLGPCEPGTAVKLQGIVWQETDRGLLVINVTWKGKTYMGTLLDCNRQLEEHKYGPPREAPALSRGRGRKARNCRSRTPPVKGKGGKHKGNHRHLSNSIFAIPASPLAQESKGVGAIPSSSSCAVVASTAAAAPVVVSLTNNVGSAFAPNKRRSFQEACYAIENSDSKDRDDGNDSDQDGEDSNNLDGRSCSSPERDACLIECPKPECSKKFRDLEALKFHLSFSHNELKAAHDAALLEKKRLEDDQAERKAAAQAVEAAAARTKKADALRNQDKENEGKKTTIMASSATLNVTSSKNQTSEDGAVKSELPPTNGFVSSSDNHQDGVLDLVCKKKSTNNSNGNFEGSDCSKGISSPNQNSPAPIALVKPLLTSSSHQVVTAPNRVPTNSSMNSNVMNGGSSPLAVNHNNSASPSHTKVPSPAYSDISDEENDNGCPTAGGSQNPPVLLPPSLSKPPIQVGLAKPNIPSSSTSALSAKLNNVPGKLGPGPSSMSIRPEYHNAGVKPTSQTIGPPLADLSRGPPGFPLGMPRLPSHLVGPPGFTHPYNAFSSTGPPPPAHGGGGGAAAAVAALAAMSSNSRAAQEILSRATSASQALDLLQHAAVANSFLPASGKLQELHERALNFPHSKTSVANSLASMVNSHRMAAVSLANSSMPNRPMTMLSASSPRSLPLSSTISSPPKHSNPFMPGVTAGSMIPGLPNFSLAAAAATGFPMSSAMTSTVNSSIPSSIFHNTLHHHLGGPSVRGLPPFPPNSSAHHPR